MMEAIGKIGSVARDLPSGQFIISFMVSTLPSDLETLTGCDALDITAKRHREKRSLNANAYYWTLIGKLSTKLKIPAAELHNTFLRKHPVFTGWIADIPDTEEDTKTADNSMTFHLYPTSQVRTGKDGKDYRTYRVIKGSHEYDTKQMSQLIDDIVDECKGQGIETLTPDELERMKASWKN